MASGRELVSSRILLFVGILLHFAQVANGTDITNVGIAVGVTDSYLVATTPSSYVLTATFGTLIDGTSGPASAAGSIEFTFNSAIFAASKTPSVTASLSSGTATFTAATDASSPPKLTLTLASGSVTATTTATITVTDGTAGDIVAFGGSAAQIQISAVKGNGNVGQTKAAGTHNLDSFYTLVAPTITLTSGDLNSGTTPTSLQVAYKVPFYLASSQKLELVASQSVFTSGVISGLTDAGSRFSSYQTSSATTFEGTLGGNLAADTAVDFTLPAGMMAALPGVAGAVTIDFKFVAASTGLIFDDASGFGTIVSSGGAGSDPIAFFNGVKRVYELPLNNLTPLLAAPDIEFHGSVFPGNPSEQWFDRMVLTDPDETRWMEVKVKKDLEYVNASRIPPSVFSTMDVRLGYGKISNPVATTLVSGPHEKIPAHFLGQDFAFRQMRRNAPTRVAALGALHRECVDFAGKSVHAYICTSPADEYYGDLRYLSLRYMHLDLAFVQVRDFQQLEGLLPELWGVKPMSETTKAYLKDTNSTSTALAGGLVSENISVACAEKMEPVLSSNIRTA